VFVNVTDLAVAGHVTYRNTRSGQHCSIFPDVTRDKLTQQELTLQCPQFQKSGFGRRSCKVRLFTAS